MKILKEFREFAVKGNMLEMAVGIIIGAAFSKIVSSLVNDIIMPPIGAIIGGVDFTTLTITVKDAEAGKPPVMISYGKFIQTLVDFVIIAFSIFAVIKAFNSLKRQNATNAESSSEPGPPKQELLLAEIRDILKKKSNR